MVANLTQKKWPEKWPAFFPQRVTFPASFLMMISSGVLYAAGAVGPLSGAGSGVI